MSSTFHGIETAKRSLFTQQAALNTTGHNIANASTPGYSRQRVNMTASIPLEYPGMTHSAVPGQLGSGVEFASITRLREKFLDDQFRNENKELGSWSVQADTLEKLEAMVNEPSDTGLRTVLSNFWSSWSELSQDPENLTGRKIVRENALALADAFNQISKQLGDLRSDLTANIGVKADQINSIASGIANLNQEIQRIEALGDNANDLRDQRDYLVDNLSKIVNVTVTDTPQGYTVSMGGTSLVTGNTAAATSADALTAAYGAGDLNSGEVYGMIVSRDTYVADYQQQLDTLANTIANGTITVTLPEGTVLPDGVQLSKVQPDGTVLPPTTFTGAARTVGPGGLTVQVNGLNGLHKLGYIAGGTPRAGGDFFVSADGGPITAAAFRVSPEIVADPGKIAASMRMTGTGAADTVIQGNNSLAVLMSQLKDTAFDFGASAGVGKGTIEDYYRSVVGQLGVQADEANRQLGNQQALVDQVDARRQSVSGVSLDEEMSDMIKFQHAYNAAARFMTAYDELLDKLINGTGQVGR
jgi:flagellar hook-associated protein 1 FlgK